MRSLLPAGAIAMAAGVALGAFGAHGLKARLDPEMLAAWQTAVSYHLVHALGMVVLGLAAGCRQDARLARPGWMLGAGVLLFSGSLYLLALGGARWLGAVTPLGGVAFIAGWLWLGGIALRRGAASGTQG